jgi:hypothetical protein
MEGQRDRVKSRRGERKRGENHTVIKRQPVLEVEDEPEKWKRGREKKRDGIVIRNE